MSEAIDSLKRVGYVLKRYPRYSETFIVNEIIAHEADGLEIEIFSLLPPADTHFQDILAEVHSPVSYLPSQGVKVLNFWTELQAASKVLPNLWNTLSQAEGEDYDLVYQAIVLSRYICEKGIQHLHAHFATSATTVARLASLFTGIPYTFTMHAKDIFHESVKADDLRKKYNDAFGVITICDYNVHYLNSHFGFNTNKVRRIYNGLDIKRFPFSFSIKNDKKRIVSVGRLVEKKGFTDLIEACKILTDEGETFECNIIGTGELERKLLYEIKQLSLENTVKLLGAKPQQDVIKAVSSATVFAAPCIVGTDGNKDGLPTTILEAMALGVPCVSTDVSGISEVIHNNETGIIAPQHSPRDLSEAIKQMFHSDEFRKRLAFKARKLIEEQFDIRRNSALVRQFFYDVFREKVNK